MVEIYPSDQYVPTRIHHPDVRRSCLNSLSRSFLDQKWGLWFDVVPAKDLFIKVRLLVELGDGVVVSDQVANLTRDAILFLMRIDVDKYISQVFSQNSNLYIVSFCFFVSSF
ncbi:putative GINS complex, subunit Psf1 protein [Helianthus anomalus]